MANQWFRLYGEFAHDPKVQMLSEVDQRRLIMLFCFRCNDDVTLQDEEVTFQLRCSSDDWLKTKATFIERGFIDNDNNILNWDKRQYVSDSSTARVQRHREKVKQDCNVSVTPQNRTEQIQNRTEQKNTYSEDFAIFWSEYPTKVGKDAAYASWKKKKPRLDDVMFALSWQKQSKNWTKEDGKYIPMPATYLNQGRWKDEEPIEGVPF
jgi:hypothetical protein